MWNSAQQQSQPQQAPVCLIADDSVICAKQLRHTAESRGWRACTVDNGMDALRALMSQGWDAVFLDDQMPQLSGVDCVAQFRQWEVQNRPARQNNVYLISGCSHPQGMPPGFDGMADKPLIMAQVVQLLDSISASRGGSQQPS